MVVLIVLGVTFEHLKTFSCINDYKLSSNQVVLHAVFLVLLVDFGPPAAYVLLQQLHPDHLTVIFAVACDFLAEAG